MRYIRTSSLVSCCLLFTEITPWVIVSCLRSRERFFIPLPFCIRSVPVLYAFCIRSISVLCPFRSRSHTRSVSVPLPFPFAFPVRFLLIGAVQVKPVWTCYICSYPVCLLWDFMHLHHAEMKYEGMQSYRDAVEHSIVAYHNWYCCWLRLLILTQWFRSVHHRSW